jgi:hypothetical protein
MYMQSGQCQSEGEVLAGLYTSALTLAGDPDFKNFDAIAPKFRKMWEALRDHPEDVSPFTPESKRNLMGAGSGIVQELQRQHMATIAGRHEQGMETFRRQHAAQLTSEQSALEAALFKTAEQQETEEQQLRDSFRKEYSDELNRPSARDPESVSKEELERIKKPSKQKAWDVQM